MGGSVRINARRRTCPDKQNGEWIDADEWFDMIERGRLLVHGNAVHTNFQMPILAGFSDLPFDQDGTTMLRVIRKRRPLARWRRTQRFQVVT